jgi:deoxyadenosine/deoxycytidine kinase
MNRKIEIFGAITKNLQQYCKTIREYGGKLFGYYDLVPDIDKTICACDNNSESRNFSRQSF